MAGSSSSNHASSASHLNAISPANGGAPGGAARVLPGRGLDHPLAEGEIPPPGWTLVCRLGPSLARLQQLGTHLLAGKHVDRQAAVLVQQECVSAVDDDLAARLAADPSRRRLKIEKALPCRGLAVVDTGRPVPEWPRSEG